MYLFIIFYDTVFQTCAFHLAKLVHVELHLLNTIMIELTEFVKVSPTVVATVTGTISIQSNSVYNNVEQLKVRQAFF